MPCRNPRLTGVVRVSCGLNHVLLLTAQRHVYSMVCAVPHSTRGGTRLTLAPSPRASMRQASWASPLPSHKACIRRWYLDCLLRVLLQRV